MDQHLSKIDSWAQPTEVLPSMPRRISRRTASLIGGVVVVGLILVLVASAVAYAHRYSGRVYPGVTALGVDLSGMTRDQARSALLARAAKYDGATITLSHGDRTWQVTPRELGLSLDADALVARAYAEGREGTAISQWRHRLPLLHGTTVLNAQYVLNKAKLDGYVQGLAQQIYHPAVNSTLTLHADGTITASQDSTGERLDIRSATIQLYRLLSRLDTGEATLPVVTQKPRQTRDGWRNAALLAAQFARQPVTLSYQGKTWTIPAQALADSLTISKSGSQVGEFQPAKIAALLAPVARDIKHDPVNAQIELRNAQAVLHRDQTGIQMQVADTVTRVLASLPTDRKAEVVTQPIPAEVTAQDLQATKRTLDAMLSAPVTLHLRDRTWTITQAQLADSIDLYQTAGGQAAQLNSGALTKLLAPIAKDIAREPKDASLTIQDSAPMLVADQPGEELRIAPSVDAIISALPAKHDVDLVTQSIPARLTAQKLAPAEHQLDTLLAGPLTLTFLNRQWDVPIQTIASWITLDVSREHASASVSLDKAAIRKYVVDLGTQIYQKPRDGALTWDNGPVVTQPSVDGQELQGEKAYTALLQALESTQRTVELPVTITKPHIPTDDLPALGIKEVIAEGSSVYSGSPTERAHNIDTAATYLDNHVIAPGDTFSFNQAIGAVTVGRGYEQSPTVADQTAPGVGGGVSQVSTTTFRAAFQAGLPIVERHQHSYIVPYYQEDGSPVGFDAAVYQPYADLKFTNNTGHYILLRSYFDSTTLKVVLYGTNPGFGVTRSGPTITNVVQPPPDKVILDPTLPPGTRQQVQSAQPGEDVTLYRTVTKGGKVLYKDTFFSHYKPLGNVFKVGPPLPPPPVRQNDKRQAA